MIVLTDHVVGISLFESEGDAILVVDPNTVRAHTVAHERLKPVPRWRTEIGERVGGVQHIELPLDDRPDVSRKPPCDATIPPVEHVFGSRITERSNHAWNLHGYR